MTSTSHDDAVKRARQFSLWTLLMLLTVATVALGAAWTLRNGRWDEFTKRMRETLGPPLRRFFAPLDSFLTDLPMEAATACAIGLFVAAGIFAWCMPRRFIYLGAPDQSRWRDLRIWATLILVPYVVIYYFLGH